MMMMTLSDFRMHFLVAALFGSRIRFHVAARYKQGRVSIMCSIMKWLAVIPGKSPRVLTTKGPLCSIFIG